MSIPVVTVGDSRDDLVDGLERLHGPVSVVRRCGELAELLAACQSGLARAAVVAAGSEELTASLVDRLSAVGVVVIALTDSPEESARLRTIGVAAEPRAVDAPALAARISAAVAQLSGAARPGPAAADGAPAETTKGHVPEPSGAHDAATVGPAARGRVIAVWGPAGAPGRTLVAANIAGELAAEGKSVLLIDADSYGASVAALLGLLDEAAGLAQACRLADQGLLDADALLRIATTVATKAGTFRVLTGITRADRWSELRAAALTLVLERAREIADVIVVDTGFCLEADEELSFDAVRAPPQRRDLEEPGTGRHGLRRRSSRLHRSAQAGPRPRRAAGGRPGRIAAGGHEQSPGRRGRAVPGTSTQGCVGAIRPCRAAVRFPAVGPRGERRRAASRGTPARIRP